MLYALELNANAGNARVGTLSARRVEIFVEQESSLYRMADMTNNVVPQR